MIGIGGFIMFFGDTYSGLGSLMIFTAVMLWAYRLILRKLANAFQTKVLNRLENWYKNNLRIAFKGARPYLIVAFTFVLLFGAFAAFGISVSTQRTKIEFFPDNTPNQIIVYLEYPQGTTIEKTNAITKEIEKTGIQHHKQ